ncbi:MAG: histidine--tRNA ligase [Acidobacteria bacterium]|nr:histidine--tRNA ligase [Acidobacteriota bacterium]
MTQETLLTTLAGMRDLLPDEVERWQYVEERARVVFGRYGFREIRTPVLEATELFARGIGRETDIVGKEMYTFQDQSGKSVTLRPEATASVVRAYAQHAMYRGAETARLYYLGPMFRHEKKQKGRWRQFYQIGAEVLGSDHPAVEAEAIEMVLTLLEELSVDARLLINSVGCGRCRPAYVERLRQELRSVREDLCQDCRRRTEMNALRVLDCKVESCQPLIARLPRITEDLCEECRLHFDLFRKYLTLASIRFEVVPRLVRGLDYYVRTAFEIVSGELGAQNALVGGGRYDGLSEILGGPPAHGFGFAMGLDRLVMLLPERVASSVRPAPDLFLVHMGEAAFEKALELARILRREGIGCSLEFGGGSLKSQLRIANRLDVRHVLIIGENELASDRYIVKDLTDSSQRDLAPEEILGYLRGK